MTRVAILGTTRDQLLFEMTKFGVNHFAPADWVSDMPAFEGVLNDEQIWAVLAYTKSQWPEKVHEYQRLRNEAYLKSR